MRGLYKTGLSIANAQVVLELEKRIAMLDAKAKSYAELKKKNDELKRDGKDQKVDGDRNPKLNWSSAHVIVKFLLPVVDISRITPMVVSFMLA